MGKTRTCLSIALLLLVSGAIFANDDAGELKAKVLGEWQTVLGKINTARWVSKTEHFSTREPSSGAPDNVYVFHRAVSKAAGWVILSDSTILDADKNVTKQTQSVKLANAKYEAELAKANPGAGWALRGVEMGKKDSFAGRIYEVPCPWLRVGNVQLNDLLADSGFSFARVETPPGKVGSGIVRGHFVYKASRPNPAMEIKSGYIDFDSRHAYKPLSNHYNRSSGGLSRGVLEYEDSEGIPILKEVRNEFESRSEKGVVSKSWEYTTISKLRYNGGVADEEFRLSYYDIPEPEGIVWPAPSRWYLWFIGAALLSLSIGFYLFRRMRRSEKVSGPFYLSR